MFIPFWPVRPEALYCAARCYATLMTTITHFAPDCVFFFVVVLLAFFKPRVWIIKKAPGFTFPVLCFWFPLPFMIIAVLTLVNRSVIIAGQLNIGADDNLSNCKHMKSSQSVHIALWMCFAVFRCMWERQRWINRPKHYHFFILSDIELSQLMRNKTLSVCRTVCFDE